MSSRRWHRWILTTRLMQLREAYAAYDTTSPILPTDADHAPATFACFDKKNLKPCSILGAHFCLGLNTSSESVTGVEYSRVWALAFGMVVKLHSRGGF